MLRKTTQMLIDSLGYERGFVGAPMAIGANLEQTQGSNRLLAVPAGQVFLITHFVGQVDVSAYITTFEGSPQVSSLYSGVSVASVPSGNPWVVRFRGMARWNNLFRTGGTPNWMNSPPSNPISWQLKYPIAVPGPWTINGSGSGQGWGNGMSVHGFFVDAAAARTMGFQVDNTAGVTSDNRVFGVASDNGSGSTLITGRAGKSIRILDIDIRFQPETNTASVLTLQQGDGRRIFRIPNSNPAEMVHVQCSPDIFLKAGEDLEIDAPDFSCSVNVSYEFVDASEVPDDHWWSCVDPTKPTPTTTGTGFLDIYKKVSTELTLYYPGSDTTGTSPGKGFQHFLRGYVLGAEKTSVAQTVDSDLTEQTRMAITSGPAAGAIAFSTAVITGDGYHVTPVWSLSAHDQVLNVCAQGLNIPGNPDDGSFWFNTLQTGPSAATTPSDTEADIAAWGLTMWGRRVPNKTIAQSNRGV